MYPKAPDFELFDGSASVWSKARENNDKVVVCFHRFGASPFETKPIAEKVVELGIDAIGPLMPGHGIKNKKLAKKEMSKYGMKDWLNLARQSIENARKQYKTIYTYG